MKPFYVMECGARGLKTHNDVTEDPGFWTNGARIATTKINAFQRAWFALEAVKQGFSGVVAWDAYFAKYDLGSMMHYSMIGLLLDQAAWPKRPAFRVLRLLMRAVEPGWRILKVDGGSATQRVVGFRSDGDPPHRTIAGLDTAGRKLNEGSPKQSTYTIGGLPKNTRFQLSFWNLNGDGLNTFDDEKRSDAGGSLTVSAPLHSMFVLTTRISYARGGEGIERGGGERRGGGEEEGGRGRGRGRGGRGREREGGREGEGREEGGMGGGGEERGSGRSLGGPDDLAQMRGTSTALIEALCLTAAI